jgi:hypothetical protein
MIHVTVGAWHISSQNYTSETLLFFPWTRPVDLSVGDRVQVTFRVHLMQDHYVWSWHTCVDDSTQTQSKARFTQASFAAQPTVSVFDEEA